MARQAHRQDPQGDGSGALHLPFEPEIFAKHRINAVYVGHPLARVIPIEPDKEAARRSLGIDAGETVVALLPGSRRSEIQYIAPRVLAAAAEMARQRPGLRFVVPVVTGLRHVVEPLRRQYAAAAPIELLDGRAHEALAACDVAVVASGTATLETALFKRPMVVVYAMHALTWQMGKRMAYLPWVSLPNILLKEAAVPELLQRDASAGKIAAATFRWLDDPSACAVLRERFLGIHHELRRDTPRLATEAIEAILTK